MKAAHRNLVDKLIAESGARQHHFKRAVHSKLKLDHEDQDQLTEIRISPDAYLFDHERKEVICYEVETTSSINEDRLAPYVDWWWFLDAFDWNLRLIILRGYNCHGVAFEIDLRDISLTWDSYVPIIVGKKIDGRRTECPG